MIEYWQNRTYGLSFIPPMLDSTMSSRFNWSTPLHIMIEQMMVENWTKTISYDSYFHECALEACRYSVTERRDIPFLITILLGIIGGLNVALKILIPLFASCAVCLSRHKRSECPKTMVLLKLLLRIIYNPIHAFVFSLNLSTSSI